MSSEFTANETTPLRTTADTIIISGGGGGGLTARSRNTTVSGTNNNNNNNSSGVVNTATSVSGTSTTNNNIYISNHHNNNNNRFDPERPPGTNLNNNNNINNRKMETNRQIFQKVVIDFIVLMCVGFPILFFFLFGEPYKRGFFCDDESLKHPFKESTVKNWMLYIIGLVLPIAIILVTEYVKVKYTRSKTLYRSYKFLEWDIPPIIVQAYKQIGVFGFGAAVSQLTTDIAKYSIGRLRPHFFDVCRPIFKDKTNCSDPKNFGIYHENFDCSNPLATKRMIKEMRLSFPSGHSSFSAFTMIYCAIYLHSRMTWKGSKLLRHFLQFILVMLAWGTALSRISNYKHHWSDALSGSVIGSICALVVANYVSDLCTRRDNNILPTTSSNATTMTTVPTRNDHMSSPQSTNGRV